MNEPIKTDDKTCFVVMPITDPDGYDNGHFARVYEFLIKPACERANIKCTRADDVKTTNYIVIDVLHRILKSTLVICDLSSRNPNVLYELGIRQAFNLPVVLIKDKQTDRIFDIQGLRTLDYDETLRVDTIKQNVSALTLSINKTLERGPKDVNSLIQLLGVQKAELQEGTELSGETSLVLNALRDISQRLSLLEQTKPKYSIPRNRSRSSEYTLPRGESVQIGDEIYDNGNASSLGIFDGMDDRGVYIRYADGDAPVGAGDGFIVSPDSEQYPRLSTIPF